MASANYTLSQKPAIIYSDTGGAGLTNPLKLAGRLVVVGSAAATSDMTVAAVVHSEQGTFTDEKAVTMAVMAFESSLNAVISCAFCAVPMATKSTAGTAPSIVMRVLVFT